MSRISIIYHQFPHYRRAVLRELVSHGKYNYEFFASHEDVSGIKAFTGDDIVDVKPLDLTIVGSIWRLKGYWPAVTKRSTKAIIVIGNPNMPASWWIALSAKFMRKKILFWSHGWLKREKFFKRWLRNIYFSLADAVLVYGERSAALAHQSGFNSERVQVIFNSLDYGSAAAVLARLRDTQSDGEIKPQDFFSHQDRPVLFCSARLTEICRFDLLLEAASHLKDAGIPVNVLLVGDGPMRPKLETQAKMLGVDIHFFGSCYNEEVLGRLIYHSDITVSPGKIGLAVIHSLTYGTPAITHGDMDNQMPEAEAIEPGISGLFFKKDSAEDLCRAIVAWLQNGKSRSSIRQDCQNIIAKKWNPSIQRERIESVLDEVLFR